MRLAALALGAALFVTSATADEVVAVHSAPHGASVDATPIISSTGQMVQARQYPVSGQYSAPSQTLIGRWIELERRKNAWLRQRFLGR